MHLTEITPFFLTHRIIQIILKDDKRTELNDMTSPTDPPTDRKKPSIGSKQTSMTQRKKLSVKNADTLGQALRLLRQSRGFTLQRLADQTGTHVGNLSRIERDLSKPGLDLLFRLADAMNYSLATLFAFTEKNTDMDEEQSTLLALFMTLPDQDRALLIDFAEIMHARNKPPGDPIENPMPPKAGLSHRLDESPPDG